MTQYTVGQTILEQMGGAGKLRAMVGGTPVLLDNGLFFGFKGCRKANRVQITLRGNDTYTMTFYKFSPKTLDCRTVGDDAGERSGVYANQLISLFEQFTGLTLRL